MKRGRYKNSILVMAGHSIRLYYNSNEWTSMETGLQRVIISMPKPQETEMYTSSNVKYLPCIEDQFPAITFSTEWSLLLPRPFWDSRSVSSDFADDFLPFPLLPVSPLESGFLLDEASFVLALDLDIDRRLSDLEELKNHWRIEATWFHIKFGVFVSFFSRINSVRSIVVPKIGTIPFVSTQFRIGLSWLSYDKRDWESFAYRSRTQQRFLDKMGKVQQSKSMMMIMMIQIELLTVQNDLDYMTRKSGKWNEDPQLKIKDTNQR